MKSQEQLGVVCSSSPAESRYWSKIWRLITTAFSPGCNTDGGRLGLPAEQGDNFLMSHLSRPRKRLRPGFGILFFRNSAMFQEQTHQCNAAPAACPAKGCAAQNVVAMICTRAGL